MAAILENGRTINPADVHLVQDGRLLLGDYGIPAPVGGTAWDPTASLASGTQSDLGYYGEDGFGLTPEPGDNKRFVAHNEDVVIDRDAAGTWAVDFAAIQKTRAAVEAYFDTTVDPVDGSFTLTRASVNTHRDLVTLAMLDDKPVLMHFPRVKVANREAVRFSATALNSFGMTLRAFKDPITGYIGKVWDATLIETAPVAPTVTATVPESAQEPAGVVLITGTGFTGATQVRFGAANAIFNILSDTQITAFMPAGSAGTANLTVTNGGGTSSLHTFARS